MNQPSKSGLRGLTSSLTSHIVPSHNPIQLAAISNYKLAQLTFAPPDLHSLRKTAVIKNMIERVYSNTPTEWLQQMTRWQYFTPESLEEMTQEGLEEIFAQYAQTIEAFRPVKSFPSTQYQDTDLFDDDVGDSQGDDLWIAAEEQNLPMPPKTLPASATQNASQKKTSSTPSSSETAESDSLIFSHPNSTLSSESVENSVRTPSPLVEKPLPVYPAGVQPNATTKQARRKSGFAGNKNRLSWTSDTGVTSGIVSQNLANEIMSLFDMDFSIDIKVNTAPKLPELPFKPKRSSQHRRSQDMMATLMPAFEKIALENSMDRLEFPSHLFPPPPQLSKQKPSLVIRSVPKRSSSLRHRQELLVTHSSESVAQPLTPPATPDLPVEKSLSKKKSILRLASLMAGKKVVNKDTTANLEQPVIHSSVTDKDQKSTNTPRKTSTSTIESTTSSSSWSFISDSTEYRTTLNYSQKLLPKPPVSVEPKLSFTSNSSNNNNNNNNNIITNEGVKKARTTSLRKSKKKRQSVMEKTMSKQKSSNGLDSTYTENNNIAVVDSFEQANLNVSKSAFIKIGNGLKAKRQSKQTRKTVTKGLLDAQPYYTAGQHNDYQYHSSVDIDEYYINNRSSEGTVATISASNNSFVKRMASFNWRMKPRHKPVEA